MSDQPGSSKHDPEGDIQSLQRLVHKLLCFQHHAQDDLHHVPWCVAIKMLPLLNGIMSAA